MRTAAAVLALLHAGLSTQAFVHLADAVLRPAPVATQGDFPCAGHSCGCATAEACRTHCCCFPKPVVRACCHKKKASKPVSCVEASRCRGETRDAVQHATIPAALPVRAARTPVAEVDRVAPGADAVIPVTAAHPPDKVPIGPAAF